MSTSFPKLPAALEAERAVIGAAVAFPESGPKLLSALRPQHFMDERHRAIMVEADRLGAFDAVTIGTRLRDRFEGIAPYLLELGTSTSTSAHLDRWCAEIREASAKRLLFSIADGARDGALNGQSADDVFAQLRGELNDYEREQEATKPRDRFTLAELWQQFPSLKPPVIVGLLRQGETANIVAPSKFGKSWLANLLGLSVLHGIRLFERFDVTAGSVLLLDTELHPETLSYRTRKVAESMGVESECSEFDFVVRPLRGRLVDLDELLGQLDDIEPGEFSVIIFDSKYRLSREGTNENDNNAETLLYNAIDRLAARTNAAAILIHHSSKGNQAEKRTTDVGAGAGAQARAADSHIVLREHEQSDCVVLDAALRSFAPIEPLALRWAFPLWLPADDVDPTRLRGKQTRSEERQADRDREGVNAIIDVLRKSSPATARQIRTKTRLSRDRCQRLLDRLVDSGDIAADPVTIKGNVTHEYSLRSDRK